MISMLIYSCKQDEFELLKEIAKDAVAYDSDESLDVIKISSVKDVEKQLLENIEIGIIDITEKEGLQVARALRLRFPKLDIVIISDNTISPVLYLTPDIRAAALLLKPFVYSEIRRSMQSLFVTMQLEENNVDFFSFENEGGKRRIPYSEILYFEARNRRIYIRLQYKEYGIHGTMDALEQKLPEIFQRCHRGFIVNVGYIRKAWYSKNYIDLKNHMEIPLSRSYKTTIKEAIQNGKVN